MFKTPQVEAIYRLCAPCFKDLFTYVNDLNFSEAALTIEKLDDVLKDSSDAFDNADERAINDLFLLKTNIKLLDCYKRFWEKIVQQEFSDSWNFLQDGLDLLRILKKFLIGDVYKRFSFVEHQFKELELLYPYKLFLSVSATCKLAERGGLRNLNRGDK